MSEKILVLVKEPNENGRILEIQNDLKSFQKFVDGHIEKVPFSSEAIMIFNEEGKLRGMPFNFHCWDDIVGPVIICGVAGEEFSDVPIHAVAEFGEMIAPVELGKVARYVG